MARSHPEQTIAVVVTYNRKALLVECLNALLAQSHPCSILIVDNASTDGTKDTVHAWKNDPKTLACQKSRNLQIVYHRLDENIGGAGGFCEGLRQAVLMGYSCVWGMDDDAFPGPDALAALLAFGKAHPDFGFLASKVLWKDGSYCRMNEPKFIEGKQSDEMDRPIRQASFVSFFLRAQVIEAIGLPLKDFFIWGDDVEYTRRISASYPCWYVPESVVIHKCADNVGSDISRASHDRLDRYRYAYRNEVYIARQEGFSRKLYQMAKICLHTARVLVHAPDHKKERLAIIWSASKSGLHFSPRKETVNDPRT